MGRTRGTVRSSIHIIITFVLVFIVFMIALMIPYLTQEKIEEASASIKNLLGGMSQKYDCKKLDNPNVDDFERHKTNVFTVDMGPEFNVNETTHFGLHFKEGTWVPFNEWMLDSWNVKCTDGERIYTVLDWNVGKYIRDVTVIQKTANRLYGTTVDCGHVVNVTIKTGNRFLGGTNGEVSLCYFEYR